MSNVKLAIVIPYYNIDFFQETLQSLTNQINKNFKLYIGNDASPNDPKEFVNSYLGELDYSYFSYEKNLGKESLALQWERILTNVKEEWFQILGDDDTISENFVSEFYENIDKVIEQDIHVIRFKYFKINACNKVLNTFELVDHVISSQYFMFEKLNWRTGSSLSENIFRTSKFLQYGFNKFPLAWHTDDYAILRFSDFGYFYTINTAFVKVRITDKSITGSDTLSQAKDLASFLFYRELLMNSRNINYKPLKDLILNNYLFNCRKLGFFPEINLLTNSSNMLNLKFLAKLIKSFIVVSKYKFIRN